MVINLNDKQTKTSKEGLISVSHPLAAKIGKDVLDQGGNAMDAVIAIQLALNVVDHLHQVLVVAGICYIMSKVLAV